MWHSTVALLRPVGTSGYGIPAALQKLQACADMAHPAALLKLVARSQ